MMPNGPHIITWTNRLTKFDDIVIMALCKTAASLQLMHLRYHCLTLSHRYDECTWNISWVSCKNCIMSDKIYTVFLWFYYHIQVDSCDQFTHFRWGCFTATGAIITLPQCQLSDPEGWVKNQLISLRWRHNDHDGGSNHQPHGCLLNRLFRRKSKKTSKLRVTGLCVGNSPGPVNSPHKGPVTRKMFPFDDVIMFELPHLHHLSQKAIQTGFENRKNSPKFEDITKYWFMHNLQDVFYIL